MVHIKRIELSHFKSFGGTTKIPILPGFTVVSGPNGSGKSNILDALLFCLGLATSKGMRAERLPDLVNHKQANNNNKTSETSVTVTFDLSEEEEGKEWSVTRRLRVTKSGSYSSQYYMNDQPCNATELHEQLNRLRIYPEGYNVVLQGDVTRIITMNSKERREIIDELAGVAEFDRKINQAKNTLDAVKEREDRCRIIEQELISNKERLAADKIKAEKYQKLKQNLHEKQAWEIVLIWKSLQHKINDLQVKIATDNGQISQLTKELEQLNITIDESTKKLAQLNSKVKELGEEEQISVASKLATQKAKFHQLQSHLKEIENHQHDLNSEITNINSEIKQNNLNLANLTTKKNNLINIIPNLNQEYQILKEKLTINREKAQAIASQSQQWLQEQTELNHNITQLQKNLNPKRTEQAQLNERQQQLINKVSEQNGLLQLTETDLNEKQNDQENITVKLTKLQAEIPTLTQQLKNAEHEVNLQQETKKRLFKEQQEKQRQLDKLEATKQAQQEAQGTFATKIILQSQLKGVCGLVCQLGQVETRYQLALEISAGSRLGCVVVENDEVGAIAIELLKQKRAGRATFLPLNKINPPRLIDTSSLRHAKGFIDLAVNLVNYESRYHPIFAYVFGNTLVFETLDQARSYLGKYRIVTLNGEILESSGAMTGGSQPQRSSLSFGTSSQGESKEFLELRDRLAEIETILGHCDQFLAQNLTIVKELGQELTEKIQQEREEKLKLQQLEKEIKRLIEQKERLILQVNSNSKEREKVGERLTILAAEIPQLELELGKFQGKLDDLEAANSNQEWQEINALIKVQEKEFEQEEGKLREKQAELKDLENQEIRLQEKSGENEAKLAQLSQQLQQLQEQEKLEREKLTESEHKIKETEHILEELNLKLKEIKQQRDQTETILKNQQNEQQNKKWQREKLELKQEERTQELSLLNEQLREQEKELPDPLPEIPNLVNKEGEGAISFANYSEQLEQLQKEIKSLQKRIEALEPVNMLALEEYQHNEERLQELTEKLTTLAGERTELLLRIENFTTLRFKAFSESFNAVNENFKTIFETLSEGDGHLQLENPENPFEGGLNLVAHPKGKPVQRLSSMSGGEKSLTALSFIFSLQRYRPSPFYAFDEVDMFLDGANVEKLAKMIKNQAQEAQFIVVSLRRPMIEASQRTIGVTQARGAYTQVLGIKL